MKIHSILMKILVMPHFFCDEIGILRINFNNIDLDNYFHEDDPDTIILIRLLAGHIKFEKRKALEKR